MTLETEIDQDVGVYENIELIPSIDAYSKTMSFYYPVNLIVITREGLSVDYTLYDDPVSITLPNTYISSGEFIEFSEFYTLQSTAPPESGRLLQDVIVSDDTLGNLKLGEIDIPATGFYPYYVKTSVTWDGGNEVEIYSRVNITVNEP